MPTSITRRPLSCHWPRPSPNSSAPPASCSRRRTWKTRSKPLAHSRYRLDDCCRKLDDALGLIVSRSPELLQLWQRMKRTWCELRSLRTAFLEISRATQLDGWFLERAQADEPLFAGAVGYDVDETLIRDWVE